MPRNITVTFADGSTAQYLNTPDNVTPEQVTERAQKEYGVQVTSLDGGAKPGVMDAAAREAKVLGSAAVRGAVSLPALGADLLTEASKLPGGKLLRFVPALSGAVHAAETLKDGSDKPMQFSNQVQEFGTKPETTGEKYRASGVEGIVGALASGPGAVAAPLKTALSGLTSGLSAELAGQAFEDIPMARLIGGLAGGKAGDSLANLGSKVRPQSASLASEAVEGLSPDTLKAAQAFQAKAKASGVNIDLSQALEAIGAPAPNLTTLRNALANSAHGDQVKQLLNNQPKDLEFFSDVTVANLPGPVWGQGQAANAVQEAATGAVKNAKEFRSAQVNPEYEKIGALPEGAREKLLSVIDSLMDKPGRADAFKQAAAALKAKIGGTGTPEDKAVAEALQALNEAPRGKAKALAAVKVKEATEAARAASSKPLMAADVNRAIPDATGPYKGTALSPADPEAVGQIKFLAGTVNRTLQDLSPEVRRAEEQFGQISREVVDPLKQSVVGRLATPKNYKPDVEASTAKLDSIFSKGSDAQVAEAARDIPKMFNELKKVDPDAAPAAAKAFIRSRLDKSFGSLPGETIPGAVTASNAAKRLQENLFANRAQEQGMKDIAVGIARSYGKDEGEIVRGLSHFMQITKAAASRPETLGGLNWKDIAKAGGKSTIADVARVYGFMPFERVARKIEDAVLAKTFQEFDRVLTTPEGADLLLKLAATPNMSNKAARALAIFGATVAATPADSANSGE